MDEDLDDVANSIIDQLKGGVSMKKIEKDYPQLTPEEVDAFVLKYGSMAVIDLSEALKDIADIVKTGGTDREMVALAEVARAFQGNLEVLQKRAIANDKNNTQIKIKKMDIQSKTENSASNTDPSKRIGMSREELFKFLTGPIESKEEAPVDKEESNVIDV